LVVRHAEKNPLGRKRINSACILLQKRHKSDT
jgi:hypothetical protein